MNDQEKNKEVKFGIKSSEIDNLDIAQEDGEGIENIFGIKSTDNNTDNNIDVDESDSFETDIDSLRRNKSENKKKFFDISLFLSILSKDFWISSIIFSVISMIIYSFNYSEMLSVMKIILLPFAFSFTEVISFIIKDTSPLISLYLTSDFTRVRNYKYNYSMLLYVIIKISILGTVTRFTYVLAFFGFFTMLWQYLKLRRYS